jgi:hypothetical protein
MTDRNSEPPIRIVRMLKKAGAGASLIWTLWSVYQTYVWDRTLSRIVANAANTGGRIALVGPRAFADGLGRLQMAIASDYWEVTLCTLFLGSKGLDEEKKKQEKQMKKMVENIVDESLDEFNKAMDEVRAKISWVQFLLGTQSAQGVQLEIDQAMDVLTAPSTQLVPLNKDGTISVRAQNFAMTVVNDGSVKKYVEIINVDKLEREINSDDMITRTSKRAICAASQEIASLIGQTGPDCNWGTGLQKACPQLIYKAERIIQEEGVLAYSNIQDLLRIGANEGKVVLGQGGYDTTSFIGMILFIFTAISWIMQKVYKRVRRRGEGGRSMRASKSRRINSSSTPNNSSKRSFSRRVQIPTNSSKRSPKRSSKRSPKRSFSRRVQIPTNCSKRSSKTK